MSSATVQHSLVAQLEAELLPVFREALSSLETQAPTARFSVLTYPVGSVTSFQGFSIGISCMLADVADSDPDEVALILSTCHLNERLRINAEVAWGNGYIEADLSHEVSSDDWPFATSERLAEIRAALPRLISVLGQAAQRGRP